ncbi:MAG: hypothetical protein LBL62_02525 [Planctomycetaceae bacterium]|nr:hypothetical protein [Planctomycetaceae bacterium]
MSQCEMPFRVGFRKGHCAGIRFAELNSYIYEWLTILCDCIGNRNDLLAFVLTTGY